jgi:hypothetical protein
MMKSGEAQNSGPAERAGSKALRNSALGPWRGEMEGTRSLLPRPQSFWARSKLPEEHAHGLAQQHLGPRRSASSMVVPDV